MIAENESAYPELRENEDYIVKVIKAEEERFQKTIDQGYGAASADDGFL